MLDSTTEVRARKQCIDKARSQLIRNTLYLILKVFIKIYTYNNVHVRVLIKLPICHVEDFKLDWWI